MNVRKQGVLLICVLLLIVPVIGKVDTSSWGGMSKPEMDVGFLGELATHGELGAIAAIADMGSDFGLDTNAMFRPADEWKRMANTSRARWAALANNPKSSEWEINNAAALAVKQQELAISKYQATNDARGSNDVAIAQTYISLADTYHDLGPEYDALRYQALEMANEANPLNMNAYNQRIQMLNDRGMHAEAEEVKGEMDQAYGESALNILLPLSPLTGIAGLFIVVFLSGKFRMRKK
jgi:hypothetical protein